MKILLTGGDGMLARALVARLRGEHDLTSPGRDGLDVTSPEDVRTVLEALRPDLVLHCAAWTDVDGCEGDPGRAFRVNGWGTRNVAATAARTGAVVVYFSTDYVFDGETSRPYREYDRRSPLNAYGSSKAFGEDAVRDACPRHYIVRTSGLFGRGGASFPATMRRMIAADSPVDVVSDQRVAPTYAPHLAEGVARLIPSGLFGTYHLTSTGHTDWFTYARKIFEESKADPARVRPITTTESARPALRPAFSVLDIANYCETFSWTPPTWAEGLKEFLEDQP